MSTRHELWERAPGGKPAKVGEWVSYGRALAALGAARASYMERTGASVEDAIEDVYVLTVEEDT